MNITNAIDLMTDTEKRMKEIDAALHELRNSLAAIAELDNGARADLVLKCDGGASEMYIGNLIGVTELTVFVKDRIEMLARSNFEKLLGFKPVEHVEAKEAVEVNIPEELMKKKEPEAVVKKASEIITETAPTKKTSKDIVSDLTLRQEYFKHGRTVKEIAEQYNVGVHGLYKRIEKMQQEMKTAAKERARR